MPNRSLHMVVGVLGSFCVFCISVWNIWIDVPLRPPGVVAATAIINDDGKQMLLDPIEPANFPYQIKQGEPYLYAKAATVYDHVSKTFLFHHHADDALPVASLIKIVTALVSIQEYSLDQEVKIPMSVYSVDGSKMHLLAGDILEVEELLAGLLLPSGNDAAYTLAHIYPFGFNAFVQEMNNYVKSKGLLHTQINNPVGYDFIDQVSSAHDLALLSSELLKNSVLKHMVSTVRMTIAGEQRSYQLKNTNSLLVSDPQVTGLKTGTSEIAGENIIISWEVRGRLLIGVILNSVDRYADARSMMSWVNDSFVW